MQYVKVEQSSGVVTVTLSRPERHNAFDETMIAELDEAFSGLGHDDEQHLVVLRAEGRSFCSGADLNWMRRMAGFDEDENRRDAAALAAMLRRIADCPLPVVARVHAGAYAGGAGLVAAADFAIAAESAEFAFTEVRLGLIPATISPHVVEKIGTAWTRRLFLTGERFSAGLALQIGLLYRVVPDAELDAALDALVATLLEGGRDAQRRCKQLVRIAAGTDPSAVDRETSALLARVRTSPEGREGVQSFLEKRPAAWRAKPA